MLDSRSNKLYGRESLYSFLRYYPNDVYQTADITQYCKNELKEILWKIPVFDKLAVFNFLNNDQFKKFRDTDPSLLILCDQVKNERLIRKSVNEYTQALNDAYGLFASPSFAQDSFVPIPVLDPKTNTCQLKTLNDTSHSYKLEDHATDASFLKGVFDNHLTRFIVLEERNVYCGPYSLLILHEKKSLSKQRILHCDSHGIWIAICEGGPSFRKIEFLSTLSEFETTTMRELDTQKISTVQPIMPSKKYKLSSPNRHTIIRNKWRSVLQKMRKPHLSLNLDHLRTLKLKGHAGTVHALWCNIDRQIVLTTSYDTSIRMWSLEKAPPIVHHDDRGLAKLVIKSPEQIPFIGIQSSFGAGYTANRCLRIFHGHLESVICLWMDEKIISDQKNFSTKYSQRKQKLVHRNAAIFASGSEDCTCRVWTTARTEPLLTLKNSYPITSVIINDFILAFGDTHGRIKVFKLKQKCVYSCEEILLKFYKAHSNEITALRMDTSHIASVSKDCFLKLWSVIGDFRSCLLRMLHPDEVLCLEMMYLRAITGCKDGKIRIWNLLNGQCQRIIRGNNKSDPITQLYCREDSIVFHTISNIILLRFEKVDWDYRRSKMTNEKSKDNRLKMLLKSINGEQGTSDNQKSLIKIEHSEFRKRRANIKKCIDGRILKRCASATLSLLEEKTVLDDITQMSSSFASFVDNDFSTNNSRPRSALLKTPSNCSEFVELSEYSQILRSFSQLSDKAITNSCLSRPIPGSAKARKNASRPRKIVIKLQKRPKSAEPFNLESEKKHTFTRMKKRPKSAIYEKKKAQEIDSSKSKIETEHQEDFKASRRRSYSFERLFKTDIFQSSLLGTKVIDRAFRKEECEITKAKILQSLCRRSDEQVSNNKWTPAWINEAENNLEGKIKTNSENRRQSSPGGFSNKKISVLEDETLGGYKKCIRKKTFDHLTDNLMNIKSDSVDSKMLCEMMKRFTPTIEIITKSKI